MKKQAAGQQQTMKLYATAWSQVLDASEIKKHPEEEVKKAEENYKALYEQSAKKTMT